MSQSTDSLKTAPLGATWPEGFWLKPAVFVFLLALVCLSLGALTRIPALELRLNAASMVPEGHLVADIPASFEQAFGHKNSVLVAMVLADTKVTEADGLRQLVAVTNSLQQLPDAHLTSLAKVPFAGFEDAVLSTYRIGDQSDWDAGRVQADVTRQGLDDGRLLSADQKAAAFVVAFDGDPDLSALRARLAAFESADVQFLMAGAPLAQAALGASLWADLLCLLPAIGAVIAGLLWLVFRRLDLVAVLMAKIGLTGVLTAGAMAVLGLPVFVPTLILPIVLVFIAVSEDVFLVNAWRRTAMTGPQAALMAVRHTIRPIAIASVTTAAGLAALSLSPLAPYRAFGASGVLGIGISFVLTVGLLPICLSFLNAGFQGSVSTEASATRRLEHLLPKLAARPAQLTWPLVLVIVCVGLSVPNLRTNDNWLANLDPDSEVVRDAKAMEHVFPGSVTLGLWIRDAQGRSLLDPDVAHRVMHFEQSLLDHPAVMQIESAYGDILRANAVIRDQAIAAYTKPLRDGARRLQPGELAEGDMVLAAFGDPTVARRISPDTISGAVTLRLKAADYQSMRDLLNGPLSPDAQAEAGVRVAPFGEAWDGYSAIDLLVDSHITTTSAALAAIFGLVALMMRSVRFAFAIMVPMTITLGCVYAFLSLTGLTLGLATSMFAAVAIGASADYAIHFAVSWRAARHAGATPECATHAAYEEAGQAILSAAFIVAGGVSVMLLSSIPPNTALASLILASLFCSALMTLFVLPGLLTFLDRRGLS